MRTLLPTSNQDDLLGCIYDAACHSEQWPKALKVITILTRSKSAVLLYRDHEISTANTFSSYGVEEKWLNAYNRLYGTQDSTYDVFMASLSEGEVTATHHANSENTCRFYSSQIYREFFQPQNMHHLAGAWIFKDGLRAAMIGLQRSHDDPPYETTTLEYVKNMIPHFQRALHIHKELTRMQLQQEALFSGIDQLRTGIILFDRMARVVYANQMADSILHRHPAIRRRGDTVTASISDDCTKLRSAIMNAVYENTHGNELSSFAMGLRHVDMVHPLPVVITPVKKADMLANLTSQQISAVMFLCDPERPVLTSPKTLQSIYDLTTREAEVAINIANGMSLTEIARVRGIQPTTVRTQLNAIFNKTGVSRQTDLVRLVMNVP